MTWGLCTEVSCCARTSKWDVLQCWLWNSYLEQSRVSMGLFWQVDCKGRERTTDLLTNGHSASWATAACEIDASQSVVGSLHRLIQLWIWVATHLLFNQNVISSGGSLCSVCAAGVRDALNLASSLALTGGMLAAHLLPLTPFMALQIKTTFTHSVSPRCSPHIGLSAHRWAASGPHQ